MLHNANIEEETTTYMYTKYFCVWPKIDAIYTDFRLLDCKTFLLDREHIHIQVLVHLELKYNWIHIYLLRLNNQTKQTLRNNVKASPHTNYQCHMQKVKKETVDSINGLRHNSLIKEIMKYWKRIVTLYNVHIIGKGQYIYSVQKYHAH